jgi:hypothetical protein
VTPVTSSPDAPTAKVSYLKGSVFIGATDKGPWQTVKKETPVFANQFVKTGNNSSVELTLPDDAIVRLAPNTLFKINQAYFPKKRPGRFSATLLLGRLWAKVTRRIGTARGTFNTHTPTAVAGVRGTVYNLKVAADKSTNIWVYEGKVGVGPPLLVEGGPKTELAWPGEVSEKEWEEIILGRLQQLYIGPDGNPGKPRSFDPAKVSDQWTVWNFQRDKL